MQTKTNYRKSLKEKRNHLSLEEVEEKSRKICNQIENLSEFQKAKDVLIYAALGNEVDLKDLFLKYRSLKTFYYPKTIGNEMEFYEVTEFEQLEEGNFHVLEPNGNSRKYMPNRLSVILIPGLVFSKENFQRIGYGKAYYDRYLKNKKDLYKVGIAYDFQVIEDKWEIDENDIALDSIISEKECYRWI